MSDQNYCTLILCPQKTKLFIFKEESEGHGKILIIFDFCTENDTSDQTLESYKSKSNEESPGHEKNGQGKNLQPTYINLCQIKCCY